MLVIGKKVFLSYMLRYYSLNASSITDNEVQNEGANVASNIALDEVVFIDSEFVGEKIDLKNQDINDSKARSIACWYNLKAKAC